LEREYLVIREKDIAAGWSSLGIGGAWHRESPETKASGAALGEKTLLLTTRGCCHRRWLVLS
jgi:hypothetical protein